MAQCVITGSASSADPELLNGIEKALDDILGVGTVQALEDLLGE